MTLTLTPDDLVRWEAASRVLVSPLAAPSLEEWQREVCRTLRDLFCTDRSLVAFPVGADFAFSEDLEPHTITGIEHFMKAPALHGQGSEDPLVDLFFQRRHQRGIDAVNYATVNQILEGGLDRCTFHNEVLLGSGFKDCHVLFLQFQVRGTLVNAKAGVYYEKPIPDAVSETGLLLLQSLRPSLRAGLDALVRLDAQRAALDTLCEALVVFDPTGREIYRNPPLIALLQADSEPMRLEGELGLLAHSLCALGFPRRQPQKAFDRAEREVRTAHGHYTLRGTLLPPGAFGIDGAVMISVATHHSGPLFPSPEMLRERHGLTRREAEIALLLAAGFSNEEIARRLFISAHTARKHTEHVLEKLGLKSRKALAIKLLDQPSLT